MTPITLQHGLPERERQLARELIAAILHAADPYTAMQSALKPISADRPTHILAFGKASIAMTHAALNHLGPRFARASILAPEALVLESQFKSKFVHCYPCDHPLPTERNRAATQLLLEHARSIPSDHRALVLISGGASAMLCAPKPGVSLLQIRQTTAEMLKRGATIQELNQQRTLMDSLKGGGLARDLRHVIDRRVFLLSDVIGDDPRIIASGPMHDATPPSSPHIIIANNESLINAARAWCSSRNIDCPMIHRRYTADASEGGGMLVQDLRGLEATRSAAIILGGEPIVNAENHDGIGGPMLELGLGAVVGLESTDFDWTILSMTSDGIDGPSNAAGMVCTRSMLDQPGVLGTIRDSISSHDSLPMCDTLNASIKTGPTGTNVNDLAVLIRWASTQYEQELA